MSVVYPAKKHYLVLDGLRGVAAMIIVVFHFMEVIITDFSKNILAHGYLAVDFFFCLSGFVVAYAYDDRMKSMGFGSFFKQRLKRLHPLVILGTVIGLLAFLFDPFSNAASGYSFFQVFLLFITSALLIPYPVMEDRYFNLFGLNAPSWSLFWEYVANIIYALVLVKLPRKWLLLMACISATLIVYITYTSGSLVGGWNGATFWHGGARMLFSFLAGMCILRYRFFIKNRLGFAGLAVLLIAAFLAPYNTTYNWITEPLIVLVYFPFIIALGAGSVLPSAQEHSCRLSGNISYPLYITHYFVLWPFAAYYNNNKENLSTITLTAIVIGLIVLQLLVAYLAMKYYDKPIRKKLMH
jgi:peptidoglycan/LPS O-acetylase OafA/YrhL